MVVKPMEFQTITAEIKKTSPALLLVIVDLTDLPNSFYDGFAGKGFYGFTKLVANLN